MALFRPAFLIASPLIAVGWSMTVGSQAVGFVLTILAIAVLLLISNRLKPRRRTR